VTSNNIDRLAWLRRMLATGDTDLMREMHRVFAEELVGAEADSICGAGYGERSDDRVYSRNGYLDRAFEVRSGQSPSTRPSSGKPATSPTGCSSDVLVPSGHSPRSLPSDMCAVCRPDATTDSSRRWASRASRAHRHRVEPHVGDVRTLVESGRSALEAVADTSRALARIGLVPPGCDNPGNEASVKSGGDSVGYQTRVPTLLAGLDHAALEA
jgi:hypothetical protein